MTTKPRRRTFQVCFKFHKSSTIIERTVRTTTDERGNMPIDFLSRLTEWLGADGATSIGVSTHPGYRYGCSW